MHFLTFVAILKVSLRVKILTTTNNFNLFIQHQQRIHC